MNRITYCITAAIALFALISCNEDPDVIVNAPSIELQTPTDILRTSATLSGQLTQTELSDVSEVVILLGENSDFESSTLQTYTATCQDDGSFSVSLRDLDIMTSYFYQAYATNGYDKVTSTSYSFTTAYQSGALLSTPELTDSATNTFEVEVEDDGGADITAAGFCWGLSSKPTIYDSQVLAQYDESSASFSASLTGLAGAIYYIRAFAANDAIGDGSTTIAYSDEIVFDATEVEPEPEPEEEPEEESEVLSIPDANFKAYLVENFDTSGDGEISVAEAEAVTRISAYELEIESLEGIEYFVNITTLVCYLNELTSLDLSQNTKLTYIACHDNQLTLLDVSNCSELDHLYCAGNQLTALDVSNNLELVDFRFTENQLTTLDVSKNTKLTSLGSGSNPLGTLDVSQNSELETLWCYDNQLTTLDLSRNTKLAYLQCNDNQFATLDVSNNTELTDLICSNNSLTTLDLSNNTKLTYIVCYGNQLTTLDVSNNVELTYLYCTINQLTALDVSNNVKLTDLICTNNQLTTLDVSNNIKLASLECDGNQLTTLDISNNVELTYLYCTSNPDLYTIYVWEGFDESNYPDFTKDSQATYVIK